MMYTKINIIEETNGVHLISGKLYTYLNDKEELCEFDNNGNLLWHTERYDIYYRYHVTSQLILYYLDDRKQNLFILNREDKQILKIEKNNLNITNKCCYYENKLYSFGKENVIIYDLQSLSLFGTIKSSIEGRVYIIDKGGIVTKKVSSIYVYNKTDFSLLWQKDLSEQTSYINWDGEHKGEIYNIYSYKDNIIVVAGNSVMAMNVENGEIQWQTAYDDFQPYTLHIEENIGYLCKGAYYSSINLGTGEKLLEVMLLRPFGLNPKYKNSNLAIVSSDMSYHDGYFYFTDKHEGQRYLGRIEPRTGFVEEYQILEGIDSNLHPPKFYNDKMFLLDSKSTLHIYEKDKISKAPAAARILSCGLT